MVNQWTPPDDPDDVGGCCVGSAFIGPQGCTCWEPVYDLDQAEPDLTRPPGLTPTMCVDCAYRPGSPERDGHPDAAADRDSLEVLVITGDPFWCHQGMRLIVAREHPDGRRVDIGSGLAYDPPIVGAIPYRANGRAGLLCAGWSARVLRRGGD
jgi:hypothetical protein